jgi:hypothetical protein
MLTSNMSGGSCAATRLTWRLASPGVRANDPNFTAKAADVVGLYVAPPAKAYDIRDITSWNMARRRAQGHTEDQELEDWREAEAQKLVDAIINAKLGARLTKNTDITAIALAKLNEELPQALMAEWMAEDEEQPTLEPFDPHADTADDEIF